MNARNLLIGLVMLILAGVGVAIAVSPKQTASTSDPCIGKASGAEYRVTIQHDQLSTQNVAAQLCDKLIITNADDKARLVAFGQHDHHLVYDGVEERLLKHDESLEVTLNQAGEFIFHDHFQDEVKGSFVVSLSSR